MTNAEYAMLLAFENGNGKFIPDLTVQHHRDVLRVLQRKKYIAWNPIGDGYILLSSGKAALAEERLQRNEDKPTQKPDRSSDDNVQCKHDVSPGCRIAESIVSSVISAAVDFIVKKQ